MLGFISMGILVVSILYVFIAGSIAGMLIADKKELVKLMSPTWKLLLALSIVFWPVSALIGAMIKE